MSISQRSFQCRGNQNDFGQYRAFPKAFVRPFQLSLCVIKLELYWKSLHCVITKNILKWKQVWRTDPEQCSNRWINCRCPIQLFGFIFFLQWFYCLRKMLCDSICFFSYGRKISETFRSGVSGWPCDVRRKLLLFIRLHGMIKTEIKPPQWQSKNTSCRMCFGERRLY